MIRSIAGLCLALATPSAWAIGSEFTYQGLLRVNDRLVTGSYDFQFLLMDARGGTVAPAIALEDVAVTQGTFTRTLDFGALAFTGADRFLQVGVREGSRTGAYTLLTPNVKLSPVPYAQLAADALFAATVDDGAIGTRKLVDAAVTGAKIADGGVATADLAANSVTSAKIADLTITDADIGVNVISGQSIAFNTITSGNLADNSVGAAKIINGSITSADAATNAFWMPGGNAGIAAATQYLGTSDGRPFQIRAGGGVGINTPTPLSMLHVQHSPAFEQTAIFTAPQRNISLDAAETRIRLRLEDFSHADFYHRATFTPDGSVRTGAETGMTNLYSLAGLYLSAFTNPSTGKLTTVLKLDSTNQVDTFAQKPGGGSWSALSDKRLKHDIQPLTGALDRLLSLRGVTFEYNDSSDGAMPTGEQTGFVAQEVQAVFPDWVDMGPDGYLRVGTRGFEAMAVEALRELRLEHDALRERVAGLERRLAD